MMGMAVAPDKQKEYGADCIAIGMLFLADYFMGKGKTKDKALDMAAKVIKEKARGVDKIINPAIQALRAQQQGGWISVNEQLPTHKDAIKTGDIMACDGWGDYCFIHWHDFRVRVNEFTHWQPLPAPPEPKEG